jgi:hypothetical protein
MFIRLHSWNSWVHGATKGLGTRAAHDRWPLGLSFPAEEWVGMQGRKEDPTMRYIGANWLSYLRHYKKGEFASDESSSFNKARGQTS